MSSAFSLPREITKILSNSASQPTHTNVIGVGRNITTSSDVSVFEALSREMERTLSAAVHDMSALRRREGKRKIKGDIWESFCKEWLLTLPNRPYFFVWLLSEVPEEILQLLSLKRVDSGIDLICQLRDVPHTSIEKCGYSEKSAFLPVQCKFRGKTKAGHFKPLQWKIVDSFVALVSLTGPWQTGLIMTNTNGFGRRSVPVHHRFRTLAKRTFDATGREQWLRMAGMTTEYRLGEVWSTTDDTFEPEETPTISVSSRSTVGPIVPTVRKKAAARRTTKKAVGNVLDPTGNKDVSPDEMREARLKRLASP